MDLLDQIMRQNPWWTGGRINVLEQFTQRKLYPELERYMPDKQIIALTGLRRVGKTTLIHQLIEQLLKEKDPKRVLYFSFDEILAKNPEIIENVISAYRDNILKGELQEVYLFLDEINTVPDWQIILKRYYDLDRRIKFVVSGSSSPYIRKTKESLAGRIFEFHLKPLDYAEFLKIRGIEVTDPTLQKQVIKTELGNYFLRGAFPEIANEEDFEKTKRYINSVTEKIIYTDIPKAYDVDESQMLMEIYKLIAKKPGILVEYKNIASTLSMSYQTVSKYVSYLEKAYLIQLVYNYSKSAAATARKAKKAYLVAPSLATPYLDNENDLYPLLPQLAENAAANKIDAKQFYRKYYEIDFLDKGQPIEVKYSDNPDTRSTIKTAKKLKAKKLTIITKDLEKKETKDDLEIEYTPMWKWLLTG